MVKENAHQSKQLSQPGSAVRVEAAGCKFEYGLNLFPGYMKLFNDFPDARTRLKVFKNRSHGHPGIPKHPRAAASVRHAFHGGAL